MRGTIVLAGLAAAFWFALFSPWTASRIHFWLGMTAAGGVLVAGAVLLEGRRLKPRLAFSRKDLLLGLASAAVLYLIFWLGDLLSRSLLPFAGDEIAAVYDRRDQAPLPMIGLLLVVWIGPAEEVFWRGFLQQRLTERLGRWRGYLIASAMYAGVHLWAANLMLFTAALVCGLFWGAMYARWGRLWPAIVSHALWDLAIFVLLPL